MLPMDRVASFCRLDVGRLVCTLQSSDRDGLWSSVTDARPFGPLQMSDVSSYRIEVGADPANPGYYRWAILQNGQQLDLPGYAYASVWSAEEAARTALRWHLILNPLRSEPDMGSCPSLRSAVGLHGRSGKLNWTGLKRLLLSKPVNAHPSQT